MCGIAAVLDASHAPAADEAAAMVAALRHRGPDGDGVHRDGPALLVHTRLAIIDVEGGDQPLMSEDGQVAVVVNGEIYNHLALRAELESRGHRFRTGSDCEVIVHLYEEMGVDCVTRLNGMFAFALWDAPRQRLMAARDPFGVKPLYWSARGRRIGVASEISALRAAGMVGGEPDPIALDHLLAWRFVPAPRTLFEGVSKLAAASVLVAEPDGAPRVSSYREAPGAPLLDASLPELASAVEERFVDAVERQMMSDVPYGCFLSGGIDSAAIAAAMAQRDDHAPLAFTIGFPGGGSAEDERSLAAETSRLVGAQHSAIAMTADDFRGRIRTCVAHLEEPCGISSAPALLQLSEFAARTVKVVLSGQGADEPFGGYRRHQAAAMLRLAGPASTAVAGAVGRVAGALPRNERAKRAVQVLAAPDAAQRLLQIFEITPRPLRESLTGTAAHDAAQERRALADAVLQDVADRDIVDQALYLDTHLFLPDGLLVYGDKMSMAHSLEQRVPFLDVELMRFVERIPGQVRVRGLRRKWLHRQAMASLVPAEVLDRPKRGFHTPYDRWLRESLGAEVGARYAPGTELAGLIDGRTVHRLVQAHRRRRSDNKRVLYCLLELAEWHDMFAGAGHGEPVRAFAA